MSGMHPGFSVLQVPMLANFTSISRVRILSWARKNGLVAFGIVGSALTIFQGIEPFLKLSRFALWLVSHWREIVVAPWVWLGSFVNLTIPDNIAYLLTLYIFVVTFFFRSTIRAKNFPSNKLIVFSYGTIMLEFLILSVIVMTSSLRRADMITASLMIGGVMYLIERVSDWKKHQSVIKAVIIIYPLIFWIAINFNVIGRLYPTLEKWPEHLVIIPILVGPIVHMFYYYNRKTILSASHRPAAPIYILGGKNALLATALLFALICMNWIGLHTPSIKAWLDKVTSLSPS